MCVCVCVGGGGGGGGGGGVGVGGCGWVGGWMLVNSLLCRVQKIGRVRYDLVDS